MLTAVRTASQYQKMIVTWEAKCERRRARDLIAIAFCDPPPALD